MEISCSSQHFGSGTKRKNLNSYTSFYKFITFTKRRCEKILFQIFLFAALKNFTQHIDTQLYQSLFPISLF